MMSPTRQKNSLNRATAHEAKNMTERRVENLVTEGRSFRSQSTDQRLQRASRRVVYSKSAMDADYEFPSFPKSTEKRHLLTESLFDNFFLFKELSEELKAKMVDALEMQKLNLREVVMKQGEKGDFMYVVERGRLEVLIDDVKVKSIGPGEVMGELALMYESPRAATVRCVQTPCNVWKIGTSDFANITRSIQTKHSESYEKRLQQVELLKELTVQQQRKVAEVLHEVHFKKGTKIISQGDDGKAFYVVDCGSVSCIDRNRSNGDLVLGPGQYFGELALLNKEKRNRDVVAREDTTCLVLGISDFERLLGSLKGVMDKNLGMRVIRTVEIFKTLSTDVCERVVDAFKERVFSKGDTVIKENDPGTSFFVVREGMATVMKNGKETSALSEGQFFGEGSLLSNEPRSATIVANSENLRVMELEKSDFDRLLGPVKAVIAKTAEERKKHMAVKSVNLATVKASAVRPLGQGTFGLVKLVNLKGHGTFALKCMSKKQIARSKLAANTLYEKRMMVESNHPFVLRLVNTYQDDNSLYMLLEICSGGELFKFLQTRGGFVGPKHAQFISACVVSVFEYIHSRNICYRDLKPENLMIDSQGFIKMVDFGFAKVVTDKTFTMCGTPEYMAPEILLRRGHNKGVDYWAVGILMYECESGKTPFADYDCYDNRVICENILRKPLAFHRRFRGKDNSKDLIKKLVLRREDKRLGMLAGGARDIKGHPYFNGMDFIKLVTKEIKPPYVPPKVSQDGISESAFRKIRTRGENNEKYNGDQDLFADF